MDANIKRAHVFVKGGVQGIGYRYWTLRQTQGLGLTGWVRNLEDGRVEVVVEGEKNKLTELIELLKKGPMLAGVEHLDVSWEDATGEFSGFEIVR